MPLCLGTSKSVRAIRMPRSAWWAPEVHTFCPVITHSSPSRIARVVSPARSEPAPGSEYSWHQISSPRSAGGTNRCCSAGERVIEQGGHGHAEPDPEQRVFAGEQLAALVAKRPLVLAREAGAAELGRVRDSSETGVEQRATVGLGAGHGAVVGVEQRGSSVKNERTRRAEVGDRLEWRIGGGHGRWRPYAVSRHGRPTWKRCRRRCPGLRSRHEHSRRDRRPGRGDRRVRLGLSADGSRRPPTAHRGGDAGVGRRPAW